MWEAVQDSLASTVSDGASVDREPGFIVIFLLFIAFSMHARRGVHGLVRLVWWVACLSGDRQRHTHRCGRLAGLDDGIRI